MKDLFPLADRALGAGPDVMAEATSEFRPPKRGEWYLSGAVIHAYRAPNDLGQSFRIARLVQTQRVVTVSGPFTEWPRSGVVTPAQMSRCPWRRMDAAHWLGVPEGGDCACAAAAARRDRASG